MANSVEECEFVFTELNKFSSDVCYLAPPIFDERLEQFEKKTSLELPFDFKFILKNHNGISLLGTQIHGFDSNLKGNSLDEIYHFEHVGVTNKMPKAFVPFSPDGRGNHYCLDTSKLKDGICPVVFWQNDFQYSDMDSIEECHSSFIKWVKDVMIEWVLEEYNYDGTEKN